MKPLIPGLLSADQQTSARSDAQSSSGSQQADPQQAAHAQRADGPRFPAWDLLPPEQILNFRRRGG
jgi:hypothetical protein